jgi:peptidoglycan/LPS O-acetylase OafA/YrhL
MRGPAKTERLLELPSSGSRLAGVEGLRAVAASSIVLVHVWSFSTPRGVVLGGREWVGDALSSLSVGVTLFFTLSGFLLYRPFAAAISRGASQMPIRAYLRNRFLRIAPAYWAILAITGLLLGAAAVRDSHGGLRLGHLTDPAAFLQASLLLQDYHPKTVVIGIGPAWSLAVEVVFYCTLPLLVLAVARLARSESNRARRVRLLLGPPLLLLVVGLSGKLVAAKVLPGTPTGGYGENWHSVVERSFWAQADLFSFGMIIAVAHAEVSDGRLPLPARWRRIAVGFGTLLFVACAMTIHHGEQSYLLQNTAEALAIALLFAAIIIPSHDASGTGSIMRLLESRPLVAIGVASYSVFLWHYPVVNWLRVHSLTFGGWGGLLMNLLLVATMTGLLSALTYSFVERPALKLKRSTRTMNAPTVVPPRPTSSGLTMGSP